MLTIILYGLATYGAIILGKKVGKNAYKFIKKGDFKNRALKSEAVKKLAGRK